MLKPDQVASEIRKGVNAKIADGRSLYLVVRGGRGYWVHEYRDGKVRRSRGLGSAAKVSPAAARRARDAFAVGRRNGRWRRPDDQHGHRASNARSTPCGG